MHRKLFNLYMKLQSSPSLIWKALIMMLYKSNTDGDRCNYNNYRGISFVSCIGKLYECILYKRLLCHVQRTLHPQQAGFTEDRDCLQNIFMLLECARFRHKHLGLPTYVLLCDFRKAYDNVWRDGLYYKMVKEFHVPPHFVNIIRNIYSSTTCSILYQNHMSTEFLSHRGLMQGSVLSPLLWNIYINELIGTLHSQLAGITYGYQLQWSDTQHDSKVTDQYKVTSLFFADDAATLNANEQGVQHSLNLIHEYCMRWRLSLNCNKGKTEVLIMYCNGCSKQ
jgi:Reverse transcriptase (RNA-dependent DNA polymerase)